MVRWSNLPPLPGVCRCNLICWCKGAHPKGQQKIPLSWQRTLYDDLRQKKKKKKCGLFSRLKGCKYLLFVGLTVFFLPSIPGIKTFQLVNVTLSLLVQTNVSIFFWFERPIQKCFSGLIPTRLTRNALSTL